jgi:4-carboxymuconolactone decarboxylase
MYLPKKYTKFKETYPDIFKQYEALGKVCRESGPLDKKTQSLVKLGIAIGANSRGAVMSHTRKALDAGATPEDINHAVMMALSTLGFPNMISAMSWVNEVIESED